ncbi:YqfQ family protein [Natribacillus halophilus]|uniref:YqfQ-like protein n=1 Tax=Natribacillus halophilus TaxID=549003 RepID=A0A1G8JR57_9BACI|nr:YqfQ family protein [Natribacillus halophilus]SDI33665.1 YqfQ-like protein [Natribacillus halophilus]
MYGPPPVMPMGPPMHPPMPFKAVPMGAAPAPVPMERGGPPAGLSDIPTRGIPPIPASGGAGFTPGASGLGSLGRLLPMIQSAGKWLPMIQKYGPMVRQLPGMIQKANQVSKALKNTSSAKTDAPVAKEKEEIKTAKIQEPEPFATDEFKEGAQPPPKLYV